MPIIGSTVLNLLEFALNFLAAAAIFYAVRQAVIGKQGMVVDVTNPPYAMIRINGAKWHALSEGGAPLVAGETVVVSSIRGLQLAMVSRALANSPETPSTQVLPMGWRVFAAVVAALQIVHGFQEKALGRIFESAFSFSFALLWSLLASGIFSGRRNLQVFVVIAICVLTVVRILASLQWVLGNA